SDLLGALDVLFDTTVGELNEVADPHNHRTPPTTAMTLSLINAVLINKIGDDSGFTEPEELMPLADRIRGGEFGDDIPIKEILLEELVIIEDNRLKPKPSREKPAPATSRQIT